MGETFWTHLFIWIGDKCLLSPSKFCGNQFRSYCNAADKPTNKRTGLKNMISKVELNTEWIVINIHGNPSGVVMMLWLTFLIFVGNILKMDIHDSW